jgi:hypothetical protein
MQCLRCQQENPSHAKFCLERGAPLCDATATDGSYADLRAEIEAVRRSLGESLEQQTATAEILRVISELADGYSAGVRHHHSERLTAVRRW